MMPLVDSLAIDRVMCVLHGGSIVLCGKFPYCFVLDSVCICSRRPLPRIWDGLEMQFGCMIVIGPTHIL